MILINPGDRDNRNVQLCARERNERIAAVLRRIRPVGLLGLSALTGCGLAAAPCRVTSTALDIVPVVGHAAATPTNACAQTIDPGG